MDAHELIIERVLPTFDARIAAHEIVDADPARTWKATLDLDLLQVRTPLLDAAVAIRGLPERLGFGTPMPTPPVLRIGGGAGLAGWQQLGERPDRELVIGAIGVFWTPAITWREDVPAEDFADFAERGYGKIAAGWSVRPYGASSTLLTYDCRVLVTDADSRRRFRRYWWLVRPFVGHIMRATTRAIRADAEAGSAGEVFDDSGARA